ncbi:type II toxin-antitoxin system RelE family toxin [Methanobrevibacter curvatus]|uniref:type II toxin-antitoxin system RelE family toxin n=1 Tax=Methanobrevibacter curvatus TaxID=49547 RepID=UPI0012EE08CA
MLKEIEELATNTHNSDILKNIQDKEHKIRKVKYRIIFTILEDEKVVEILKIGKRTNSYKK